MYETLDIGRLYFTLLRNPPKLIERAESQESEPPYRQGRGVAILVWPRLALVIGWWFYTHREWDEEEGNAQATARSRHLDVSTEEIASWGFSEETNPPPSFPATRRRGRV